MEMAQDQALLAFGCYTFIAFVLCITSASWMINVNNSGSWVKTIMVYMEADSKLMQTLLTSWKAKPFVDVMMLDVSD